jgi:dipeptidyl aminopeptidase/acylaminoacyl peptidase
LKYSLAIFLIFPLSVTTLAFSQSQTAHDPRIDQILRSLEQVRTVSEIELSPDGKLIAWNVSDPGGIELAPVDDPTHNRRISACGGGAVGEEHGLAWSPDSTKLAFFSNCTANHETAIFLADPASNAAPRLLTPLNGFAETLQWAPNGKLLGFLYVEGTPHASGSVFAIKPPSGVIGVGDAEVQRVAAVDLTNGQIRQLSPSSLHVFEYDWSPDSSELAYVAAPPPGERTWWFSKLYTQVLAAPPRVLFDPNAGASPLHERQLAVPRWSPDGSKVAFIGGLMSDQGVTGGDIYVIQTKGGDAKNVTPARQSSPGWFEWRDEHQLVIDEIKGGSTHLFAYDIATQRELADFNLTLPDAIGAGGLVMRVSLSRSNGLAFVRSSFSRPPEVWSGTIKHIQQITHYNDDIKPLWGKTESVEWKNQGFNVQGWLIYPPNYDPAKRYPLIVYPHGGPSHAALQNWPGVGYGGVPFAGLGYFVLMPNPRGSKGQGERFAQANLKDFGYGDLSDILAGLDTVMHTLPIDPQRVGITGWSYGGFMSMFAVTQTNRFHAAVAGAGVANWQSYYGENSIDQWMIPFFGASVYDDPAMYAKSSPINFIQEAKTPTLLVVGGLDGEAPPEQSREFWHALRDKGVSTNLVVYPTEGHHFVDPHNRRDVLEHALNWFVQYMPAQ